MSLIPVWNNIIPPTSKLKGVFIPWYNGHVSYASIECLACCRGREYRTHHKRWDHYICQECRTMMKRDGIFILTSLHNIIERLGRKRYPEEEFFIRLDHILKTLKIEQLIVDYDIGFNHSAIAEALSSFYIEIVVNADAVVQREPVQRYSTHSFIVEDCCIINPVPKPDKQEYLTKEHFKWEDCDGEQI